MMRRSSRWTSILLLATLALNPGHAQTLIPSLPQSTASPSPQVQRAGQLTLLTFDLPTTLGVTVITQGGALLLTLPGLHITALPLVGTGLSSQVQDTAAGSQVLLHSPQPFTASGGWQATLTPAGPSRWRLDVTLGPGVQGGFGAPVAMMEMPGMTVPTPDSVPPTSEVAPGDHQAPVVPATLPTLFPTLSVLSGTAPGAPGSVLLPAPRVGRDPELTRLVLDLPPGTQFQVQRSETQLLVLLSAAPATSMQASAVSPEVQGWQLVATTAGAQLTVTPVTPLRADGGWHTQLLPPASPGGATRLVLDIAPALANLSPLVPVASSSAAFLPSSTPSTAAGPPSRPLVILDPGHGGVDSGATGTVTEKVVTLRVALEVRELLQAAGVDVVMTRDHDTQLNVNKNLDLAARAALASPPARLYVSMHANSAPSANALKAYGVETWWTGNDPGSRQLASDIQREVTALTGAASRGLKSNEPIYVLQHAHVPAALIEMGFVSHPVDGVNLRSDAYLDRVARGIAQGIEDMLSGTAP